MRAFRSLASSRREAKKPQNRRRCGPAGFRGIRIFLKIMIASRFHTVNFPIMKSWFSKVSTGLVLVSACGVLNSCKLFGGGKYASQTEVETDVPESLEQGKPSSGPAGGAASPTNGVPATSNLVDVSDPWQSPTQPPLPGGLAAGSLPADGPRDLIEIPKPDFNNVSVHSNRPPAEMLSLGPPVTPASTRMSLGTAPGGLQAPRLVRETVQPLPPITPADSDLAAAPKALPGNSEPGVPLLHGTARLADFYKGLHEEVLTSTVVDNNTTEPAPADSSDSLSVPPPPPDDSATEAPPPPPQ